MGYFDKAYGATEMGFSGVTEGISVQGMRDLVELMHTELLTGVKDQLEKTDSISNAIKIGWQGRSRDEFLTQFSKGISNIQKDLEAEYKDLMSKLGQLMDDYFDQDKKMMESIK